MENENEFIKSMNTALTLLAKEIYSGKEKHYTMFGYPKTDEALMFDLFYKGLQEAGFTVCHYADSNEIKITKE